MMKQLLAILLLCAGAAGYGQTVPGCTVPIACNYDPDANSNDGSCDFVTCQGCTDTCACNYEVTNTLENGLCEYESCGVLLGCTNPCACNYSFCATEYDGSCDLISCSTGCNDPTACNYDPDACGFEDLAGVCDYWSCQPQGCTDESACNYDAAAVLDDFTCEYPEIIGGCGYCGGMLLTEYDCNGDGLCDLSYDIFGCIDESACNYESCATMSVTDDGGVWECFYPEFGYNCEGACLSDVDGDGVCDALELEGCIDSEACNYDSLATDDDSSCHYDCQFCLEGTVWSEELGGCVVANVSDTDFDGCVGINDFLVHLSNFGSGCGSEPAWACGDPLEYQGYDYETVQIGEQCWFAENLRCLAKESGSSLEVFSSPGEWAGTNSATTGLYGSTASCWHYSPTINACDTTQSLQEYGRLYNGFSLDEGAICPVGWDVPAIDHWQELAGLFGGMEVAGAELKSVNGWGVLGGDGNNVSGLDIKPSGLIAPNGQSSYDAGYNSLFWTTSGNSGSAEAIVFSTQSDIDIPTLDKNCGLSIRCIKDYE